MQNKPLKAPERKTQQQKAVAFKAEKQAQGKFGGIVTSPSGAAKQTFAPPPPSTAVGLMTDVPMAQGGQVTRQQQIAQNIQTKGLEREEDIRTALKKEEAPDLNLPSGININIKNAPQAEPNKLDEVIPQANVQQDTPFREAIRSKIADILKTGGAEILLDETGKIKPATPEQEREMITETLLLGASVSLGAPLKAAASTVSKAKAFEKMTRRLTTPAKPTVYITKPSGGFLNQPIKLNVKTMGIIGSIFGTIWGGVKFVDKIYEKVINDKQQDIAPSVFSNIDTEIAKARGEQLYDQADWLLERRIDAEEFQKNLSNIPLLSNLIQARETAVSEIRYTTEEKLTEWQQVYNNRLRLGLTPKQFFERLEADKKSDLETIDAEHKARLEATEEKADKQILTEGYLKKRSIIVGIYEKQKREFPKTQAEQDKIILSYKPALEQLG